MICVYNLHLAQLLLFLSKILSYAILYYGKVAATAALFLTHNHAIFFFLDPEQTLSDAKGSIRITF